MCPWIIPKRILSGMYILHAFNISTTVTTLTYNDRRNDILRKHGIIPEKPPSPTPIIEEAILEAQRRAHENRLEDKDLDELDALEDEEDEDFLEQYRWVVDQ